MSSPEGRTREPPKLVSDEPLVKRTKAADRIIESLRVAIASGRLGRGDRLPNERELARQFGVSQPTVREAIRVLEVMGLIEVRHGSGAYVAGDLRDFISRSLQTLMQIEDVGIVDVIELRMSLAQYSISRAVRNATDENLALIDAFERGLTDASAHQDYEKTSEAAVEFLAAISAAAHSPLLFALESFLIELMLALQIRVWLQDKEQWNVHWAEWREPFLGDRRRLVDALSARDEKAALAAMNAYLEDQRSLFGAFQELSEVKLNDRHVISAVAEAGLNVPAYRDLQIGARANGDVRQTAE